MYTMWCVPAVLSLRIFGHREGHKDEPITAITKGPHPTKEGTRASPLSLDVVNNFSAIDISCAQTAF